MSLLSAAFLVVNIAVISSIHLTGSFFNLRPNATEGRIDNWECNFEDGTDNSKCSLEAGRIGVRSMKEDGGVNGWQKTYRFFKEKENKWITNIRNHIDYVNFHIDILTRRHQELSSTIDELRLTDKKTYLGKPFSLFALLKRSAKLWPNVALQMSSLPGDLNTIGHNSTLARLDKSYKLHLPNFEDLDTGIRGLSRLQQVYDLRTDDIANQRTTSQESLFSAFDFLRFAEFFCTQALGEKCQEWLEKAAEKNTNFPSTDVSSDYFLQLSFVSSCLNGNQTGANIYFQDLVERGSSFDLFPNMGEFPVFTLEDILHIGCKNIKKKLEDSRKIISKTLYQDSGPEDGRFIAWNVTKNDPSLLELCRQPAVYNTTARLLRCRYVHYNKPQLMIGPFKMEEFHIDPPVLMFHDVISDKEISEMIDYGGEKMKKATVHNNDGTNTVDTNVRTNEQGWIDDEDLPLAQTLSKRAARMSGWDLYMSEPNQLARYSPGGEFTPHTDALSEEALAITPEFADYSVIMFYISDVTAGGHTIFPALNVSLVPQKGSAALWFNRLPDGQPDQHSLHAGCPVLEGHKWVINKWFHIRAQQFPKCTKRMNSSFRYFYL